MFTQTKLEYFRKLPRNLQKEGNFLLCPPEPLSKLLSSSNVPEDFDKVLDGDYKVLRFLVKSIQDIKPVFAKEGNPGSEIPAHYQMVQASDPHKAKCLTAGNAFFAERDYIAADGSVQKRPTLVAISNKSGDFEPSIASLQFALIAFEEEKIPMDDTITLFKISKKNGKRVEDKAPFKVLEEMPDIRRNVSVSIGGKHRELVEQLLQYRELRQDDEKNSDCCCLFSFLTYTKKEEIDAIDALLNTLQSNSHSSLKKYMGVLTYKRLGKIIEEYAKKENLTAKRFLENIINDFKLNDPEAPSVNDSEAPSVNDSKEAVPLISLAKGEGF